MLVQETLSLEGADPCQFLVLYEDAAAHDLAMEVCERLLAQLGKDLAFAFSFWTFKELEVPVSAHWAVEAVSRADVILLALRGREPAPPAVSWLDACARTRTKTDGALAMIVTGPDGGPTVEALLTRMQFIARRLQMDFLPIVLSSLDPGMEARANPLPAMLERPLEEAGFNHWGLNE